MAIAALMRRAPLYARAAIRRRAGQRPVVRASIITREGLFLRSTMPAYNRMSGLGRLAPSSVVMARNRDLRPLGARSMSAGRQAAARLVAVPAIFMGAGVTTYEQLRKQVQLPEVPFLESAKDNVAGLLGSLKAMVRAKPPDQQQVSIGTVAAAALVGAAAAGAGANDKVEAKAAEETLAEDVPEASAPIAPDAQEIIHSLQERLDSAFTRHQAEIMEERERLQTEIKKLLAENEELRISYLQLHNQLEKGEGASYGPRKKSSIETYSAILDLLSKYNKDFSVQDNLPRVVVVGDQSAGKTSVLEMIAQARMFPRGHGEMMTRSPIQVTLREGERRVAKFADSSKEYDLNRDADLKQLRAEIKRRMLDSVKPGETVSSQTVSLNVAGPGLPRMVLVDLPGVIGHVTAGMADHTKDDIMGMCIKHMSNPNAIILCVQDGSVDAERSNVADLVSSVDPKGKRTVFVMTKVDVAEKHNTAPNRVRSIMEGKLFRMNALGYYAVITGKGSSEESIEDIQAYEEEFFRHSKLFREGALRPHQTTTQNLARAVSQEFWKRVRESVQQQAEVIRADLAKKELEWKNTYKGRMMTRDELFQLGKHEILESVAHFGHITPKQWEDILQQRIWANIGDELLSDIYLSAAKSKTTDFKTRVDVQLMDWARKDLPNKCVDVARDTFIDEFEGIVKKSVVETTVDSHDVFANLKNMLIEKTRQQHSWHADVANNLRVMQVNALEDEVVSDAGDWHMAADFMMAKLLDKQKEMKVQERQYFGPEYTEQWTCWKRRDDQQARNAYIRHELAGFFNKKDQQPKPLLEYEDIVTVRTNVKNSRKHDVTDTEIIRTYELMFMDDFLSRSIKSASFCKPLFKSSDEQASHAPNGLACKDVLMFWRMQDMMRVTAKTLRQQVMYHKTRLEQEVKAELDAVSQDENLKRQLISGARVDLAENIDVTRHILHELDDFIRLITNTGKPT